ncbi:MAG: hypothetical protein U0232_32280 [Thermomicrobiales bacterium]
MDQERTALPQPPKPWQRWLVKGASLPFYLIIAEEALRLFGFRPLADVVGRVTLVAMVLVILVGLGYALPSLLWRLSRQRREELSSRDRG